MENEQLHTLEVSVPDIPSEELFDTWQDLLVLRIRADEKWTIALRVQANHFVCIFKRLFILLPITPDPTSYAVWTGLLGIEADCRRKIDDRLAVFPLLKQNVATRRVCVGIIYRVSQSLIHVSQRFLEAAFVGQHPSATI